jgi:uncharacterized protein YecE (DUF72 family)
VGCSGWLYRDWRGVVYPAELTQKQWFAWYASQFDTVELNTTFYRLPTVKTVQAWRQAAPEGFLYATKLGSFATHRKRLRDPETWLANHLDRVERLRPALGPTLVQLRPRWPRDVGRLDHFLQLAPRTMRWAVELRDASWLHDDVFDVLARHGAALCLHDLLPDHPQLLTTDWTYLRFHGPDAVRHPYRGLYTGRRLRATADRAGAWLRDGVDVFAYFNNDYEGHAFTDAAWLRDRLITGSRPGEAPPPKS